MSTPAAAALAAPAAPAAAPAAPGNNVVDTSDGGGTNTPATETRFLQSHFVQMQKLRFQERFDGVPAPALIA
eukprot:330082-Pyramimonas_sp.AAC.1